MKISSIFARRRVAGVSAGCLLGGMAMGIVAAPSAVAAPDCSPAGVNATVSSVTGSAQQYLAGHPDANQVVMAAYGQPRAGRIQPAQLFHHAPAGVQRPARHPGTDRRHRASVQCDGAAVESGVGLPRVHGRLTLPETARHTSWRVVSALAV